MKDEVIKFYENVANGALNMISCLSNEDLTWKPSFEARSVLELVSHISTLAFVDIMGGSGELKSSEEFDNFPKSKKIKTVARAAKVLKDSIDYTLNFFKNISEENMDDLEVQFFYQEEPETYTHLLSELIEHLSLHKGILYVYMREMGYNAGMGTYYGFQKAVKN